MQINRGKRLLMCFSVLLVDGKTSKSQRTEDTAVLVESGDATETESGTDTVTQKYHEFGQRLSPASHPPWLTNGVT